MFGHRPFAISGEHRLFVLRQIEKTPHMTLQVLSEALAARGLKVHPATVGRFLRTRARSFKKTVLPAEQIRSDVARRRRQ